MSNRPTDTPDWATDANHPAGSNEWNGQPNKVKPSAARIAGGFDPNDDFFVEEENWILNNHGEWLKHLDSTFVLMFGDGSDGAATLDGSAAVAGCTLSFGKYTATRDLHFTDLTVNAPLHMAGYRLYVNGTLTNNSPIDCAGNVARSGILAQSDTGGTAGAIGGVGGNSPAVTIALGGEGGGGGSSSTLVSPGFAGSVTAPTALQGSIRSPMSRLTGLLFGSGGTVVVNGGSGGGGGGGGASSTGGAGGRPGGVLLIAARMLYLGASSSLSAAGEDGGGGGAGGGGDGGGGGGGGGGGAVVLTYLSLLDGSSDPTVVSNVSGGAAGAKGSTGANNGSAGSAGNVYIFGASSGAGGIAAPSAHEEHGYATITPGTGAGHEYVDVTFAQPFSAATGASGYRVDVQISMTNDGDPIPGRAITNKTTTGFRIRFTTDFDGEVRWSAQ